MANIKLPKLSKDQRNMLVAAVLGLSGGGYAYISLFWAPISVKIAAASRVSPERLYELFFESPLVIDHDEGRISTRAFYETLQREIDLQLDFDSFLEAWNGIFEENLEMSALVQRLAQSHPCLLISNTNRPHFEYCRSRYPVIEKLRGWILSYEVGFLKPHPGIYQRALEMIGLPAQNIWYIDDRSDLIEAGRSLGFLTHRFEGIEPLRKELQKAGIATE